MEGNLYLDKCYRKVRLWQRAIFLGTVATVLFGVLAFMFRLSTDIYSAPAFLAAAMFPAVVFVCFSVCKMYSWEKRAHRQEKFLGSSGRPVPIEDLSIFIKPIKTEPDTAMHFVEQLAKEEGRELTEADRHLLHAYFQVAYDKHKAEAGNTVENVARNEK